MAVSSKQYAEALYLAVKEAETKDRDAIIQSFLARLQKQGDLSLLSRIVHDAEQLEADELGVTAVEVRVAHKADELEVTEILHKLLETKKIQLDLKEDKNLIGGLIIETKNERWDLSMKNQLAKLKQSL
jgi:F0F1-type ATP synthase delta subunit